MSVEKLISIIRSDRLCDAFDFTKDKSPPARMIYEALLRIEDRGEPDPCVLAVLGEANVADHLEHDVCAFLHAVKLTRQHPVGPSDESPTPSPEGLAILRRLHAKDPKNGIYPFFIVGALSASGAKDEADAAIRAVYASEYFESPVINLLVTLHELGSLNATAYVAAAQIFASIHSPYFQFSSKFMRERKLPGGEPWARKVLQAMETIERENLTEPFFDLLAMAVLRPIARDFWIDVHGEEQIPYGLRHDATRQMINRAAADGYAEDFEENMSCEKAHTVMQRTHARTISIFRNGLSSRHRLRASAD